MRAYGSSSTMTAHPANPGVTVELIDRDATGIQPLRTDITGFVGVATRGPVGTPVPIGSWRQFQSAFGGLHPDARLADAVVMTDGDMASTVAQTTRLASWLRGRSRPS